MMGLTDKVTRAVTVSGMEILALKKLAVVSKALADRLDGGAAHEQRALVRNLVTITNRLEGLE